MGFLERLGKLLSLGKVAGEGDPHAFYLYVRCRSCGEKLRVRVDRRWDLEQDFDEESDRIRGYILNKDIMGKKCFKMMRVTMEFDPAYREISRTIEGGDFITREEYEEPQQVA